MLFIIGLLFNTVAAYTIRAYFPEWGIYGHNFKPGNVRASKITHLVYSFGVPNPNQADYDVLKSNYAFPINVYNPTTPEGNLVAYDTYAWSLNLPALKTLKANNPGLKLILAIGGWSASWHLSHIFGNNVTRSRFVSTSADFLRTSGFDGIDLDWEYPGAKGASYNFFSPEDSKNIGKLCAELRQAIGPNKELSLAISGDPVKQKYYTECIPYADAFGIMTYDFRGGWDGVAGHQSAYFHNPVQGPNDNFNAFGALSAALSLGYPRSKISIGSPFYGRGWTGCTPKNVSFPIFGTCSAQVQNYDKTGGEPGLLDYRFLLPLINSGDYVKYYDSTAQAAFAFSPSKKELWTYENPTSAKFKAQKVKENQIEGMIVWEISEDTLDSTSLLETIYTELNSGSTSPPAVNPTPSPAVNPTPVPTPAPVVNPTPVPTPPTVCASSKERCGGSTYTGPKCCVPGNICKYVDSCYSQCVPDTVCAALWAKCGGIGWTGPTCCVSGRCNYVSEWYSQCIV